MVHQTLPGFISVVSNTSRVFHIEVDPKTGFPMAKQDAFDQQWESDPVFRMSHETRFENGGN